MSPGEPTRRPPQHYTMLPLSRPKSIWVISCEPIGSIGSQEMTQILLGRGNKAACKLLAGAIHCCGVACAWKLDIRTCGTVFAQFAQSALMFSINMS